MTTVATTTTADDPRQAVSATAKRLYDREPP
jgi:hypothetical protein